MFTPRLTPSQSPLVKSDLMPQPALKLSNTNLTILRQLANDCGMEQLHAPISTLLNLSHQILLHNM
jgi:hypothetical protein